MRRKSFPFAHQSSSYKTFRLTLESREVGGGAGNLFVCLSLLETIINYGDCQTEDLLTDQATGGGGTASSIITASPAPPCPPLSWDRTSQYWETQPRPRKISQAGLRLRECCDRRQRLDLATWSRIM